MKYLNRALGGASVAARPMTRSRSPLAEADQRLHLDGLASAYEVGVGMLHDSAAEPSSELDGAHGEPGSVSTGTSSVSSAAPRVAEPTLAARLGAPSRSSASRAELARERPGVRLQVKGPLVGPKAATATPPYSSTGAPRTDLTTTASAVPSDRASSPEAEQAAFTRPGPPSEPDADEPQAGSSTVSAEPTLDRALAQVAAWLERPAAPARPKAQASESIERDLARSSVPTSAIAARAAAADPAATSMRAPAPSRLEIGSIEVELVPPAPRPVRGRSESRTAESSWSPSRPFGWRQS